MPKVNPAFRPIHPKQLVLGWQDVAVALVKAQGIHEGHWRAAVNFAPVLGINSNLQTPHGMAHLPAAILPVAGLVLMRDDEPGPLSVDAAQVNPKPTGLLLPHGFERTH